MNFHEFGCPGSIGVRHRPGSTQRFDVDLPWMIVKPARHYAGAKFSARRDPGSHNAARGLYQLDMLFQ